MPRLPVLCEILVVLAVSRLLFVAVRGTRDRHATMRGRLRLIRSTFWGQDFPVSRLWRPHLIRRPVVAPAIIIPMVTERDPPLSLSTERRPSLLAAERSSPLSHRNDNGHVPGRIPRRDIWVWMRFRRIVSRLGGIVV